MSTTPYYPGGPGYLTFNGYQAQMKEDWKASHEPTQFKIDTNLQGANVDLREENMMAKVGATPLGIWGASAISKLYPYASARVGSLIYPPTDLPLVIQTTNGGTGDAGESITYPKAALTKMPPLTFSTIKTLIGAAEWTCLPRADEARTSADSFCTVASSTYTEPSLNPQLILTAGYVLSYAGLTIDTVDGVVFTPILTLEPVTTDLLGIVNMRITALGATLTFKPKGLTTSQLTSALMPVEGAGTGRGTSLGALGGVLTCTSTVSGGPILTIPKAVVTKGLWQFSLKDDRLGEITVEAMLPAPSGVVGPRWSLSTAP